MDKRTRWKPGWDAAGVKGLRHHLGLTQAEMAEQLGVRQQTVSEWETGAYEPRGASRTVLGIVAERAGFEYGKSVTGSQKQEASCKKSGQSTVFC